MSDKQDDIDVRLAKQLSQNQPPCNSVQTVGVYRGDAELSEEARAKALEEFAPPKDR